MVGVNYWKQIDHNHAGTVPPVRKINTPADSRIIYPIISPGGVQPNKCDYSTVLLILTDQPVAPQNKPTSLIFAEVSARVTVNYIA
jgi:hypothetical protein